MAFITRQWLQGRTSRNRGHCPVKVEIKTDRSTGAWSKENEVVLDLYARTRDEESFEVQSYQAIYLRSDEVGYLANSLVQASDAPTKMDLAVTILADLSDSELVATMSRALIKREKR
ncbi:hypothetical protein [Plasticicumulans lactativorans]|uniref:hypothetical protein n=1 Tax=Plasticicumulans lactativorans TaxID=1133106 RepID=UPI001047A8E8|nr:hypothetical protein [Plasticicumulans lactativorans]